MQKVFEQSQWIWLKESQINQYADFVCEFSAEEAENLALRISADTDYAVFINGVYIYSGQYPDYPHYKVYDTFQIGTYCKRGKNRLAILCRYAGEDSSTYLTAAAGLLFEVLCGNKVIAASGEEILSRQDRCYRSGRIENISPQLGHTFAYDACQEDGWIQRDCEGFEKSAVVLKKCDLVPRPVSRLQHIEGEAKVCAQGEYIDGTQSPVPAERITQAFLKPLPIGENRALPSKEGLTLQSSRDGVYFVADMGEETAGFAVLDLEVPQDAQVYVGFGEHLHDLRVRAKIGLRNFAFAYRAKQGRHSFCGIMRRLGCRYLQIHVAAPRATLYDCRILRTVYPVTPIPFAIQDGLRRKIYENGVRTLVNCMHEHYEDCPWREQALYAMDSRNQMLFGAYVFQDNEDYARANLRLMMHGMREDGLLALCFPAGIAITIPSFSLYFVFAVSEYFERTGDAAFVREAYPALQKIMQTFLHKKDETGLIPIFTEKEYWNFYEWRPGLDGGNTFRDDILPLRYDSCLNLLYVIALQKMQPIYRLLGEGEAENAAEAEEIRRAIAAHFYDAERGIFVTSLQDGVREGGCVLAQALAVAAYCLPEKAEALCEKIKSGEGLVPATLANKPWVYDVLLQTSQNNLPFVLRDIETVYGQMSVCGDTTLYETEKGADDFDLAGSLCHGWSAVACYIFRKYQDVLGRY